MKTEKRILRDLIIGETAFVVLFAMCIKNNGVFFLDGNFFIKEVQDEQYSLKIKRLKYGFIAFYQELDYYLSAWLDNRLASYDIIVEDCTGIKSLEYLENDLEAAVIAEDFELAAKIRDMILAHFKMASG